MPFLSPAILHCGLHGSGPKAPSAHPSRVLQSRSRTDMAVSDEELRVNLIDGAHILSLMPADSLSLRPPQTLHHANFDSGSHARHRRLQECLFPVAFFTRALKRASLMLF